MSPTPGPWTAEDHPELVEEQDRELFGDDARCTFIMAGIRTVCKMNGPCLLIPVEHHDANARLIAAAPELLEAVKAARDEVDCVIETDSRRWLEFIAQLDAAIAKAEGQSSTAVSGSAE